MLWRRKGGKARARSTKPAEMFVGSFCSASVLYVASEEGLFSQDLVSRGPAFQVGWSLAAAGGMRGKEKMEKKRGRAGGGNGLLVFHFMAFL